MWGLWSSGGRPWDGEERNGSGLELGDEVSWSGEVSAGLAGSGGKLLGGLGPGAPAGPWWHPFRSPARPELWRRDG